MSSLFATIYILRGSELSRKVPPVQYLILLTFLTNIIFFAFGPLIFKDSFTFTMNLTHGVFGWVANENFIFSFFLLSLVNGCGTLVLQMLAMIYFSPVIVGTMMLLEPFFS
jgi:drug/metabolite transporter (DMT)-like permease